MPREQQVETERKDDIMCGRDCPSLGSHKQTFPEETIQSLIELGHVLRAIHTRLRSEGYTIRDGTIFKDEINRDKRQEDIFGNRKR